MANVGDSRCVLCRGAEIIELSQDHKPQLAEERVCESNAEARSTIATIAVAPIVASSAVPAHTCTAVTLGGGVAVTAAARVCVCGVTLFRVAD